MRYREVDKRLRSLGCVELRRKGGGSHRKWIKPASPSKLVVIVPDWGPKDLKNGTLRAIVKDLGLEWGDFLSA